MDEVENSRIKILYFVVSILSIFIMIALKLLNLWLAILKFNQIIKVLKQNCKEVCTIVTEYPLRI